LSSASRRESFRMARNFMVGLSLVLAAPAPPRSLVHAGLGGFYRLDEQVLKGLALLREVAQAEAAGAEQVHDRVDALPVLHGHLPLLAAAGHLTAELHHVLARELLPRRQADHVQADLLRQLARRPLADHLALVEDGHAVRD